MKKVDFGKNFTTTISGFFQYDYGQVIDVYNTGTNIENLQFEFIQNGQQISVFGEYVELTNSYHVQIPDTFLQKPEEILTYIYYEDPNKGQTIKILIVKISPREKYNPSPDPQYHSVIEQILEDLAKMQEEIDNWTISQEQLDAIIEEVESQIDLNDYYNKTEVDNLLNNKADKSEIPDVSGLATKQELNNGLSSKANSADVYTKSEVDNLIPDVSGFATKTELANGLALKVDTTALSDYYTKQQTYSQAEINALISAISTLNIEVVNSLPTQNISTTTIYLIPSQDPQTANVKDEYINLDGTSQGWELIGTTDIDLTDYVTSTQLSTILNDYVTSSGLSTILANYATSNDLTTGLSTKANSADVYSKSEVYTKTEIDATIGNIQTLLEAI